MAEVGRDIQKAAEIIRRGGLVAIPTETVYGLAANALDANAATKIFEVKGRPTFDPLIVHIAIDEQADAYAKEVPENAELLMQRFWPGPLTIVLPKRDMIPDIVTAGLDTVGIRKPSHNLTQELLRELDLPLAAPSANLFGKVSPTSPESVNEQLGNAIDYILDGGDCSVGVESTIVGFEDDEPVIYRMGGAGIEDIEEYLGKVRIISSSTSNPKAPGMLTSHYAPGVKISLEEPGEDQIKDPGVGFLRFDRFLENVPENRQLVLTAGGDLGEAARNLFRMMRSLDGLGVSRVYAQMVPEKGLGRAINDRLRRAAAS